MKLRDNWSIVVFVLLLFFTTDFAYGSEPEYTRSLSVSEWIAEMANCTEKEYKLQNAIIYSDPKLDANLLAVLPDSLIHTLDSVFINVPISIKNCQFKGGRAGTFNSFTGNTYVQLRKLVFKKGFYINDCIDKGITFSFSSCSFQNQVVIDHCDIQYLAFRDSKFQQAFQVYFSNINHLYLFKNNIFNMNFGDFGVYARILNSSEKIDNIALHGNKFIGDSLDSHILFSGKFGHVNIQNDKHANYHLNLSNCDIQNSFLFTGGEKTLNSVSLQSSSFPARFTYFPWKNLAGFKLCLHQGNNIYTAKTDDQLVNEYLYGELMNSYKNLYDIYKRRGDLSSSNGCYVEMKTIEGRQLNFQYRQQPEISTWFNWRLNQFLKYFCNYGTSPQRSLIISMWTVLGFALFYFFFYSDWDKINRAFLIRQYLKMVKYFRSEQNLDDFYSEEHKEELKSYSQFKKEMEESRIEIPFFMNALGKPLYHLSLVRHQIMGWLYRRTEILSGRWSDLQPRRKIMVATVAVTGIATYLIYLSLIRALNSTILSINTFSTLGFGDIPVKGVTRYLAILEGFLGWFLLSIFNVSLISQILQT